VADVAGGTFTPAMAVYDPSGVAVDTTYGALVAGTSFKAAATGTYTVVVYDYSSGYGSSGAYNLYLAVAPGANEGGALSPSEVMAETIDLGDLDSYTFAVTAGQGVQLRVADVAGGTFTPAMAVYDPSGAVVDTTYGAVVAGTSFKAAATGTYTVVVYDYSSGYGSSGAYNLYLAVAPGANEGGVLAPGIPVDGTIDLGDLDSFTFAASSGQRLQLQVADPAGTAFVPAVTIYSPTGAVVSTTYNGVTATVTFTATEVGTYTAVIYDYSSGYSSAGAYIVTLTVLP
jgi:hypothetical protein